MRPDVRATILGPRAMSTKKYEDAPLHAFEHSKPSAVRAAMGLWRGAHMSGAQEPRGVRRGLAAVFREHLADPTSSVPMRLEV